MSDFDDFLQGQKDCKEGNPHQGGNSEAYDAGYQLQYELEQMRNELCQLVSH